MPPKKEQDSNPTRRALSLYGLLMFSGKSYSLKQLSSLYNCSKQTILRMLEQIQLSGEAKLENRLEDGESWYRIKTPSTRPNVSLTPDELQRLMICRDMLCNLLPQSYKDEISRTINHATVLLDDRSQSNLAFETVASCASKGSIDYTQFQDIINQLINAIKERSVCLIGYKAPHHLEAKEYHFAPFKIFAFREALYIRGLEIVPIGYPDVIRVMTFPIHRFSSVYLTRRSLPKDAEKSNLADLDNNDLFGIMPNRHFIVEVRFYTQSAITYVCERTWSKDQVINHEQDGTCLLRFTAQSEVEVVKWVLGFGVDAELIAPESLRQRILEEHRQALGRYAKN